MREFVIYADSTCDLDKATREQYGIEYVAMNYIIDDQEYVASLDWESHSIRTYYDLMRQGKRVFTTQVPKNVYADAFRAALSQGKDVLYIACSSALSASINVARMVARELQAEFPEGQVFCLDSLISSLGQGHMLLEAAGKRSAGMDAAQTAAYIEGMKLRVNQCGTVASMEYLRRAGRVKASKAFFGNLFGVKPIIISDRKGQNYAYKKVKGTANARRAIAEHIVDAADGVYDTLYISHGDCLEDAEHLAKLAKERLGVKEVFIGYTGAVIGSHSGPGTLALFYLGDHR